MSVSGAIFNDANGDAIRQSNEKGLSGRMVDLEIAGKGTKGDGPSSRTPTAILRLQICPRAVMC